MGDKIKIIGILTEDFRLYYDIIRVLRDLKIPFSSLVFEKHIPSNVGIIFTSAKEIPKIKFIHKVPVDLIGVQFAIHLARKKLAGMEAYQELNIGIDPGERPGVAIIGNSTVLHTAKVDAPEKVLKIVEIAKLMYPAAKIKIKVGSGGGIFQQRVLKALSILATPIEIVNERATSRTSLYRLYDDDDIKASVNIAFQKGKIVRTKYELKPKNGEIRDIQRMSRLISNGRITISKKLAEQVAKGMLSLQKAVEFYKRKQSL